MPRDTFPPLTAVYTAPLLLFASGCVEPPGTSDEFVAEAGSSGTDMMVDLEELPLAEEVEAQQHRWHQWKPWRHGCHHGRRTWHGWGGWGWGWHGSKYCFDDDDDDKGDGGTTGGDDDGTTGGDDGTTGGDDGKESDGGVEPVCGNGVVEEGEACDDGNAQTPVECPGGEDTCTVCSSDCNSVSLPAEVGVTLEGVLQAPQFAVADTLIGYTFEVVVEHVVVTELGFFDLDDDGLGEAHDVGIFAADGTLMVSGTVPGGTTAPLDDGFRYVAVTPTTLPAGSYVALAYLENELDEFKFNVGDAIGSDLIDLNLDEDQSILQSGTGGLVFSNTTVTSDNGLYGPNFTIAGPG